MQNLKSLRQLLQAHALGGMVLSVADPFQSEYVGEKYQSLKHVSGFTGSAGLAVILKDTAALFVDGRYTARASQEVDPEIFVIRPYGWKEIASWLRSQDLAQGTEIGFDPWIFTCDQASVLEKIGQRLSLSSRAFPLDSRNIDSGDPESLEATGSPAYLYEETYAGEAVSSKVQRLCQFMKQENLGALVFFEPLSLCWLLNIRGHDVPCTPVFFCYGIFYPDARCDLFVQHPASFPRSDLGVAVTLHPLTAILPLLGDLSKKGLRLGYDPGKAPHILKSIEGQEKSLVSLKDPTLLWRACKNPIEIKNAEKAHLYDGVALTKGLYWLDHEGSDGLLDERQLSEKIDWFRSQSPYFLFPSFETIVKSGSHGDMIHYRAPVEGSSRLKIGDTLLIDSGGQYLEGTTDVTRTVFLGDDPTPAQKKAYTCVLKGMIALSQACFPQGTTGSQLDVLARQFLWKEGLDYPHGTGHGVGHFLNVHEGPQNISSRPNETPLCEGMILSNEPGCYLTGVGAIRIENLMRVVKTGSQDILGRPLLGFKTLTLVPISLDLVETRLLSSADKEWINSYHEGVYQTLEPHLDPNEKEWLYKKTRPVI